MKNKNHPSETLPIDNSCQTGLPLLSEGVFIMKEIKLSQFGKNKGKYVALVDNDDFEALNSFKWSVNMMKHGNTFYAVRFITVNGKKTIIRMHCVIMNGKGIDHIDMNGLNNQKANLRFCTNSENHMNTRKRENTSSIHKGVSFFKRDKKWMAQIMKNGKKIHLGLFASEIEAAEAYNKAAPLYHGEFANLNNIN